MTGGSVAQHHYFYSQDISTAAQQINAGVSAMDTATDPATDVACLCDPVAPELLYSGEQQHNYYPENILGDVQGMGVDPIAQNFESTPTQQSLAYHNFRRAVSSTTPSASHPRPRFPRPQRSQVRSCSSSEVGPTSR